MNPIDKKKNFGKTYDIQINVKDNTIKENTNEINTQISPNNKSTIHLNNLNDPFQISSRDPIIKGSAQKRKQIIIMSKIILV